MLQVTLIGGLITSFVFTVIVLLSWRFTPEVWLNDLTEGEVESPRTPPSYIVFIAILATLFIGSTATVWRLAATGTATFLQRFIVAWLVLVMLNLVDLVVIDWFIYMKLEPKFMQIEGIAPLNTLAPHIRGFGIGILTGIPIALIAAAITMLA
ncbi:MAG: hypothetical protein AAF490_23230 [Chloroflexota bacterium]